VSDDDLAVLFGDPPEQPSQDVRYRQGVIITIDTDTLENTVNVGGTVLTNLTVLSTGDVRLLIPGAVVGVLAVGAGTKTMFITGRILIPDTPEAASAVIPGSPGVISGFAGPAANIPAGFFVCDGTAKSRTTYADLFAAIGTTWGAGDGSTTFNLPELRNLFFVGAGITYTVGNTGGATTHTHANAGDHSHNDAGNHQHTQAGTGSTGSHSHGIGQGSDSTSLVNAASATLLVSHNTHTHGGTGSAGTHSHTTSTVDTAGDHGHGNTGDHGHGSGANLPPYAALTPIIRY
jgi:microcystin-dependent protein